MLLYFIWLLSDVVAWRQFSSVYSYFVLLISPGYNTLYVSVSSQIRCRETDTSRACIRHHYSLVSPPVCERYLTMMFPLICFLCVSLTVPNLCLTYRLVRNKLFGSVFNLHSVFMFLLTAIKTPLSIAIRLTLISGAEDFFEFSCLAGPAIQWIWGGSMLLGTFYAFLFK